METTSQRTDGEQHVVTDKLNGFLRRRNMLTCEHVHDVCYTVREKISRYLVNWLFDAGSHLSNEKRKKTKRISMKY